MTVKWYQQAARTLSAIENINKQLDSDKLSTTEYENILNQYHTPVWKELEALLPHGSGIDGETGIDIDRSRSDRVVVYGSYHCMNDGGFYTDWIEYTVRIKPSLAFDFDLLIVGNFGKRQDVKEYLYDLYSGVFSEDITLNVDRVKSVVNQ